MKYVLLFLIALSFAPLRANAEPRPEPGSITWFEQIIRQLPSDEPIKKKEQGYYLYKTQKAHWLGWLNPKESIGPLTRRAAPDRDAAYVYNHIVEPKMLLWLVSAAGIDRDRVEAARAAAELAPSLQAKSAAIRRVIPWPDVFAALLALDDTP